MRTHTSDEYTELVEQVPDNKTMYYLLKQALMKCDKLERELKTLKGTMNNKNKKQIYDHLGTITHIHIFFEDWYMQIKIERQHLYCVFDETLFEGFKEILKKKLVKGDIPIMAFTNKPNMLYVYKKTVATELPEKETEGNFQEISKQNGWGVMTNEDISHMLQHFNREIIKEFLQWQRENEEKILSNDKLQDREIEYMMKINGTKCSFDKIVRDIKKFIYDELQQTLVSYDIV
jgi:phosphoglycolate phosphatase-like HAD superfamily hydrolase